MHEADDPQQQPPQPHHLQQSSTAIGTTLDNRHHGPDQPCQVDDNNNNSIDGSNVHDIDRSLSIDDDENNNDSMVVSLDMSQNNEQPMSASEEVSEDPHMIKKEYDENNESGSEQMIEETKIEPAQVDNNNLSLNEPHRLVNTIRIQMHEDATNNSPCSKNNEKVSSVSASNDHHQDTMDDNLDSTKNRIPGNSNNNSNQQEQQQLDAKLQSSINSANIEPNFIVSHKRTKNTCSKACCPKHHHHHKHNYHQHYHQHSTDESKTKYNQSSNHNNNCINTTNVGSSSANIAREDIPTNSSTSLGSTKLGHDRKLSRLSDRSDTLPSCSGANNSLNNDTNNVSIDLVKCHHSSHQHHHHNQSHGHHHHHRHHHHNNKKRSQEMINNHDEQTTTDFTKPSQSKFATSAKVVSSSNNDSNNYCNESKQCPSFNHCAHSHHYHRHQSKHDQHGCDQVKINESKSSKSLSTCSQSSSIEIGCVAKMQTTSSSSSATVTSATTVISNASGPLATKARVLDKLDERQHQTIQSSQKQHSKQQPSHKTRSMSGNIDENTLPAPIGFQNELQSFKTIQADIIRENEPMDSSNNSCRLSTKDIPNARKHNEQNSLMSASTQPTCCNHRLSSQGKSQRHHHHHHNHHHHHHPNTHREHQAINNQSSFSQQQPIQNAPNVQLAASQQGSTNNQSDNQSIRYGHKHHHHHHHGHHKHKHKLKHRASTSSHPNEVEKPVNLSSNEQASFKNSTSSIISAVDASLVNLNNPLIKHPQNKQSDVSANDSARTKKSTNDAKNEQQPSNQQLSTSANNENTFIDVEITPVDPPDTMQNCDTLRATDTEMMDNMTLENSQPRHISDGFSSARSEDAKPDEDDGKMVLDNDDRSAPHVNESSNANNSSAVIKMDMSNSLENDNKITIEKSKHQQNLSEQTARSDQYQSNNIDSLVTNGVSQARGEFVIPCQPTASIQSTENDRSFSNKVAKEAADQCREINISNSNRQVENNLETKENIAPSRQVGKNLRLSSKGSIEKESADLLTVDPIKCSSSNFSVGDVTTTQVKGSDYVNTDRRCKLCWCCCCPCSGLSHRSICHRDSKLSHNNGGDRTNQTGRCDMMSTCGTPSLEEIRSWGESFDRLMKCYDGRRVFRDFLRCEYSEENILFWLACQELKREKDLHSIETKARMIYEDYISILSTKEVSLDSRVREVINKNMESPTADIFDEAQLQIYTLMHRDSYPRFINSSMYKKLAQLPTSSRKSSS